LFYGGSSAVTIKLRGVRANKSALAREVDARTRVQATGTVSLPRLLGHDLAEPAPFLCEEFARGRPLQSAADRTAVLEQVLPAFSRLYQACGIEPIQCGEFFDLDRIAADVGSVLAVPGRRSWPGRDRVVASLDRLEGFRSASLPGSLGHGDLSIGNMVRDENGRVSVLDWEHARPMPIGWDWRKVFEQVPGSQERYERFVLQLPSGVSGETLPLAEHWRLLRLARIAEVGALLDMARRRKSGRARHRLTAALRSLVAQPD
jgi:hypothetical protein